MSKRVEDRVSFDFRVCNGRRELAMLIEHLRLRGEGKKKIADDVPCRPGKGTTCARAGWIRVFLDYVPAELRGSTKNIAQRARAKRECGI